MIYIVFFSFISILLFARRNNGFFLMLCLLQTTSIVLGPLVVNYVKFTDLTAVFNAIFVCVNIFLIIWPWRKASFNGFTCDTNKMERISRFLKKILVFLMILDIVVLILVIIYIPEISRFKSEDAYRMLYENIPYFSILFRMVAVTQYFGLLAIPISGYYLHRNDRKRAKLFLVLSTSTFLSAIAFYSRAVMITYFLVISGFFFLTLKTFSAENQKIVKRVTRRGGGVIMTVFLLITIVRFSAMSYYADRIPNKSLIQEPISYSLIDYASQGFYNGMEQLEFHDSKDITHGTMTLYHINQVLSFFNLVDWSSEKALAKREKAYNKIQVKEENTDSAFHGYVCTMVKEFGYFFTLLIGVIYYLYVSRICSRKQLSYNSMFLIPLLMTQPCIAIFYCSYGEMIFPLLLFYISNFFIR